MSSLYDRLYRLSLTNARLLGTCPNPSNDNFLRLVVGAKEDNGPPNPDPPTAPTTKSRSLKT